MRFDVFRNPATGPLPPLATGAPADADPLAFHRTMPGYRATPLRHCPRLARRLGVGTVLVKDEATRMGLPSFKILGASWATVTTVLRNWVDEPVAPLTVERVAAAIADRSRRRLVAATDGNHGRGVARTAPARITAIQSEGATVVVVDGTYDDAIAASARLAGPDTLVVSDTSWEGYEQTPAAVVAGYSTMFAEIDAEIDRRDLPRPALVALQAGVGAFAAAGVRHLRGPGRAAPLPRTVIVEPADANCLMASARAGRLAEAPGPHRSTMAGLNCGLPSVLAWPVVRAGTDVFLAVDDDAAHRAMAELAGSGIVAGESGAAGLAGLLAVADTGSPADRDALGLTPQACVLLVNTEGATDPVNYRRVVGRDPAEVGAATAPEPEDTTGAATGPAGTTPAGAR
jgi:diaminopropionate ammonia-lyase